MKKICIISHYYPSKEDPYFAFVGTLVEAFADLGIECHVITPVSLIEKKHKGKTRVEVTKKGNHIHVYCPKYMVFPYRHIAGFSTYRLTAASQRAAIKRAYRKYIKNCDAAYAHFLDSGINSMWLGKKVGVPAFVACGECTITYSKPSYDTFGKEIYNGFNGVIYVASALKKEVRDLDIISPEVPSVVLPNSIDTEVFYPRDKHQCRTKLGVGDEDFIIAFVGGFIERKGFGLLQNILCRHPEWKCILVGSGDIPIRVPGKQIVFSGRLPHESIPEIICAADAFVLPTLAEGCCNAIVEAMGCGLPIISSDREFNDDILDDTCSLRIDPENEEEIERAIQNLYTNPEYRNSLARNAQRKGEKLSIESRAKAILEFLETNK